MIDKLFAKDKQELEVKDAINKASRIISERVGIIRSIKRTAWYNDEPKMFHFSVEMCDTSIFSEVENKSNFPGGASFDKDKAFMKALGEAIERYCLGIYNKKCLIESSYSKLGDKALNLNSVVNFSETQLKNKKIFKFSNNSEFRWVEGYSITDDRPIFVPAQLVYVPYNYENEKIIRFPISTGAAAGTSLSSALLRGICEVIERDAFMINYLNMLKREKVNPKNSTSHYINQIVDAYEFYKLELHTINISTDIPIYTFLTILIDRSKMGPAVTIGLKTSFNPKEAFIGSVEEAQPVRVWIRDLMYKQSRKLEEIRKKQFLINTFEERGLLWSDYSMVKYLNFWIKNSMEKKLDSFKNLSSGNPKKDLRKLIKFLKNKKYTIVFVDITTRDIEEIGLKVVKVIIPEMQPLYVDERFRYLGGERLYSIPSMLGYKSKSEKELNKVPHPFL